MTRLIKFALIAAIAASPAFAQEARTTGSGDTRGAPSVEAAARDDGGFTPGHTSAPHRNTRGLSFTNGVGGEALEMSVEDASNWADTVCGGDSILYFDINADGTADETSYNFDCMDDL